MAEYPKWYNVNADARVWAGHIEAQKKGWMYAQSAILAVEEYKGAVRFVEWKADDKQPLFIENPDYPDYWMRLDELSLLPWSPVPVDPTPVPSEPAPIPVVQPGEYSNEALGAALRLIVDFIRGR